MIVDLRIYSAKTNGVSEFASLYQEHGWHVHKKHLGTCLGWYTPVEGQLHQIVHLWRYDSQADRESRRARLYADPAWQAYLLKAKEADHLVHTENRILAPTDFFLNADPLPAWLGPQLVDLRIYTIKPSGVRDFTAYYGQYGWPLQQKYLGHCLGWYLPLEGQLNQVVHLWAYRSQADREQRRTALYADPAWQDYLKGMRSAGLMVRAENRFVQPASFFAQEKPA